MRVSVVIPSYEAGSLLLEALTSVQEQQGFSLGLDLEVLVADDGSARPDSAQAMAAAAAMPGVRVLRTAGRTGPSSARNLAARHAQGQWLSFLDADDRYAPDALALRWATAQAHPGVGCVVTDYAEFAADAPFAPDGLPGVIASTPRRRPAVQAAVDSGKTLVLDRPLAAFIGTVPMWTGSVFVRRAAFAALGGFPEGHDIGEDLHLWLRIAATECLAYVPRVTAYCRKGHASLTRGEPQMNLKTARCYAHLAADPLMRPVHSRIAKLVADSYLGAAYDARGAGQSAAALQAAMCALRWRPGALAAWRALVLAPFRPRHAGAG